MPDRDLVAGRSVCRSCAKGGGRGVVARPGGGAVKSGLQVRIPFAVGVGVDHRTMPARDQFTCEGLGREQVATGTAGGHRDDMFQGAVRIHCGAAIMDATPPGLQRTGVKNIR